MLLRLNGDQGASQSIMLTLAILIRQPIRGRSAQGKPFTLIGKLHDCKAAAAGYRTRGRSKVERAGCVRVCVGDKDSCGGGGAG